MRKMWLTAAAIAMGAAVQAGEISANGCFAKWTDSWLTVGNAAFTRTYVAHGETLKTSSFVGGGEWIDVSRLGAADGRISVKATAARRSIVGSDGLKIEITAGNKTRTAWLFPNMAGVLMEDATVVDLSKWKPSGVPYRDCSAKVPFYCAGADVLRLKPVHVEIGALELVDQTDVHNELVHERKYLLMTRENPPLLSGNVFWIENSFTGDGIAFLRIAPLPADRTRTEPDFIFGGVEGGKDNRIWAASVANGFPMAEVVYRGGKYGRIAAFHSIQRSLRGYVAGRDGMFLSNTWGDGNRDARISEEFMMKEIAAGGELGVDVIQIDDGWQTGKSTNSAFLKKREHGAWSNFRSANPDFWKPDSAKFPSGLKHLVAAAKAKGMGFGLWFGPDKTDDNAAWEQDADTLLAFYRDFGIRYFKVDGIETVNAKGYANQLKMFSKMLDQSRGDMTFDLDVTGCQKRPGYFGLPDTGPLFLENRYIGGENARRGGTYWPHFTLRNLWALSAAVDPVRIRIEIANPLHGQKFFGDDPLAPKFWRGDALFASVMVGSPLGWFEISELSPKTVAEMKPLVAVWKRERANLHGGMTLPVGSAPDGVVWTGFVTKGADGRSAYALLFRELNEHDFYCLNLSEILPGESFAKAELIGGRGKVELDGGCELEVENVGKLDFAWVKLTR